MTPSMGDPNSRGGFGTPARVETFAERHHNAWLAWSELDSELGDALDEVALDAWDDHTTDYYDNSVEVYFSGAFDAEAVAAKMFALGFRLCWLHTHTGGRAGAGPGVCKCPVRSKPVPRG